MGKWDFVKSLYDTMDYRKDSSIEELFLYKRTYQSCSFLAIAFSFNSKKIKNYVF